MNDYVFVVIVINNENKNIENVCAFSSESKAMNYAQWFINESQSVKIKLCKVDKHVKEFI